ncbi:NACHT, LRR and PYD domains-containing protein 12 [Desmophyllum pertusum]|uniref:NACHT, LRR and PYD domains-containing protein 12 n=1 Tax=Desmophyllum pertusum TaxID=174260 RepID=A0A9X0A2G5_9CNID|nr:NACHT, LRR and PYD domains-containing protein 12 [Desmophyllum pertusum]
MGNVGFSDHIEATLCQVGSLAKTGIEEGRLVFDSTEVQGMENCGLINRMPDSKVSRRWRANFCFIHLTLQEFLAAREIAKMEPSDLSDFITSNASDPKWHLVIQFVAGLLHGKDNEAVNSFVSLLHDSLTQSSLNIETKQKAILMMKCLHEYNNETTVEKAASELQKNSKFNNGIDLSYCQVTPVDCPAVVYFIKHLHELTELDLGDNNITDQDQGVSHLCDALKHVNCKLTELNLGHNNITDQGVSHLCDALKDVNCKLTELNLGYNNITEQGVSHLCDALKHVNCKLTKLNLGYNNITEQGVSHLCDALKDVNCKLTKLNLGYNNITEQGVSHLCDALKHVNCKLTKLNLGYNNITEQGVSHLCDALKHVNCKLTELNLGYNNITDQGVSHLCDALKDVNCKLTELDLSYNNITDQGVSHLCDATKMMQIVNLLS